jgi:hypothetical protein
MLIAIVFSFHLSAQTNDVGIINIIEPGFIICAGQYYEVKVRIKNFGTQTQTTFPVNYRKGANNAVTETFNGILTGGDSIDFVFLTKVPCPVGISTNLCYWTNLSNDNNLHNDTICRTNLIFATFDPYIKSQTNFIINAYTNSIVNYQTYTAITNYNINIHWYYTPANDVIINTNALGDSATIHFGNNASSGILSVYYLSNYCNSDTLHYNVNLGVQGINNIDNTSYLIEQNIPNPASTNTMIKYRIPSAGIIKFEVVNIFGQLVFSRTGKQQAGENSINLNVKDFTDGIYYYAIEYKGKKQFKKMMVSK